MCNIWPDHGLEGSQLVQGQGVCHEAVGKNRDELDVYQENVFRKGEPEGLEGCEKGAYFRLGQCQCLCLVVGGEDVHP